MQNQYSRFIYNFDQKIVEITHVIATQNALIEAILSGLSNPDEATLDHQKWNKKALANLHQQKLNELRILMGDKGPIESFKELIRKIHPSSLESMSEERQKDLETIRRWIENLMNSSEQGDDNLLPVVQDIFNRETKPQDSRLLWGAFIAVASLNAAILISALLLAASLPTSIFIITAISVGIAECFAAKTLISCFVSKHKQLSEKKALNIKSELGDVLKFTENKPSLTLRGLFSSPDFDYKNPSAELLNPQFKLSVMPQ
jgi:hypothetical protein